MDTQLKHTEPASDRENASRPGNELIYRSVSKAAVGSAVFAVLSLLFLVSKLLFMLPLIGLALGLIAISNIRRLPDELTGKTMARFGLLVSVLVLVGGGAMHIHEYATEVREGYDRISFRA